MITTTVSPKKKKKKEEKKKDQGYSLCVCVYIYIYIYIYISKPCCIQLYYLIHYINDEVSNKFTTVLNLTEKHLLALLKDP